MEIEPEVTEILDDFEAREIVEIKRRRDADTSRNLLLTDEIFSGKSPSLWFISLCLLSSLLDSITATFTSTIRAIKLSGKRVTLLTPVTTITSAAQRLIGVNRLLIVSANTPNLIPSTFLPPSSLFSSPGWF